MRRFWPEDEDHREQELGYPVLAQHSSAGTDFAKS